MTVAVASMLMKWFFREDVAMADSSHNSRNGPNGGAGSAVVHDALKQRDRFEETLRRSEEQFEHIVAEVRDYAIFVLDRQGRVQTWNPGAERLKGYRPEEIIGQNFSRFYPEEMLRRGLPQCGLKVAAESDRFEDEGWRVRKDGSRFWAHVTITALHDEAGEVRGFLKITRDLTERRQAEEILRESEEKFRLLVDSVADYAIFMLDPVGHIITWNIGAERIKGYRAEEIIGEHFSKFYPEEAIQRNWPEYELEVARAEGRFEDEGWRVRRDGSQFWANVVVTAVHDEEGRLRGFSKVTRDLTQQKWAEDVVRKAQSRLEARVQQRTAELKAANEALTREIEQRKCAEQALRESEQRHRMLMELMPAAVYACAAPSGTIEYFNRRAEELWGRAPRIGDDTDRFCGSSRLFLPDGTPLAHEQCPMAAVLAGAPAVRNQEVVIERPDGSRITALVNIEPLTNAAGEVVGAINVFQDVSERKQLFEHLKRSEERYRELIEAMPAAVYTTDREGRITLFNERAAEMWGRRPEIGKDLWCGSFRIFRPDGTPLPHEECPMALALREGRIVRGEEILVERPDGQRVCVLPHPVPLRDPAGQIAGAVNMLVDISDRKQAEERLRQRERQLKLVTDSAPVLIAHCSCDQRFKFVNRAYAERFGLRPKDLIGKPIAEVLGAEAFAVIAPHTEAALGGKRIEFEAEIPYRDIQPQHILCAYEPEFDSSGRVVGYVAAITNITERKRMERALAEEARTNETLYRIGRTLAAEHDLQQIVQTVTDEATSATGAQFGAFFYNATGEQGESYTLYAISGVPREVFEHFPLPRNTALFEPTFRGQATVRLDDVTRDPRFGRSAPYHGMPEGHLPVTSYLAVPVISRSGAVLGGLFFGHAEVGAFTKRHERLVEGIASQAAVAIDNARLYGDLTEADRRKDEFLALLGHELRNPLAAVVNGVHVLQALGSPDEKAAHVQRLIERQARHMTHLVEDLLDVARVSRGRISLRKERTDLVQLVAKTVDDHRPSIDESGCTLEVRSPERPLWVDADRTRLHQLLGNLLQNACKFTDPGGRITVELRGDPEQRRAAVVVRDTGIGMTPETLSRLFVPFSQAENSLDRSRGGLGLGLALVRGLVELHGGTIRAHSPGLGEGSEFTLALPLTEESASCPDEERPQAAPARRRGFRVLVAEDSRPVAEIFSMMLQELGHEVEVASSGEEALRRIPVWRPQVVFSDISMPGMSGYELAQRVRMFESNGLVLVAMTGYGHAEDRDRALAAGFDFHLVKPADCDQLQSIFEAIAQKREMPA